MDAPTHRQSTSHSLARRSLSRAVIHAIETASIALVALGFLWLVLRQPATDAQSGSSWEFLNGPYTPGGTVPSLAIAPSAPDRTYAIVRDQYGRHYRLHRSNDGGASWIDIYTFSVPVLTLAVDPTVSETLYIGGEDYLLKSIDGGMNWTQVYTVGRYIAVDPITPTTLYAGGVIETIPTSDNDRYGLAKSTNGGNTWTMAEIGAAWHLEVVAVDPSRANVLYVGGTDQIGKGDIVYQSLDGGLTWERFWPPDGQKEYGQAVLFIGFDPDAADTIFIADWYHLFKSTDGGSTWRELSNLQAEYLTIALDPVVSGTVYAAPFWVADRATVYKSVDGGETWWRSGDELPRGIQALAVHPSQTSSLLAGLADYGIYKCTNGGSNWVETNHGLQSLASVDALGLGLTPDTVFAGSDYKRGGIYRSENGGITWTAVLPETYVYAFTEYPLKRDFFAVGAEILASSDDGLHWSSIFKQPDSFFVDVAFAELAPPNRPDVYFVGNDRRRSCYPGEGLVVRYDSRRNWTTTVFTDVAVFEAVAIHPGNPDVIYIGGMGGAKTSALLRSLDGGVNWTPVLTIAATYGLSSVIIDPHHPETLYAANKDYYGVYESTDGGDSWVPKNGFLSGSANNVYAMAMDHFGTIYRATDDGVYRSADGGATWNAIGDGLAYGRINDLLVQTVGDRHYLLAGAERGGVWRYLIADLGHKTYLPFVASEN